jgi:thioredoxin-related protein
MSPRLSRKTRRLLEIAANVAIILVAVAILANFFRSRIPSGQHSTDPKVGAAVSLSGVDWKQNGSTLLMVLQQGCRYCEDSVSFYQELRRERNGGQPHMIAVVPGEPERVSQYLAEKGIVTDGLITASLADLNVSGTPTLLLVDASGHIKNVWVGKLNQDRQQDVMKQAFQLH